MKKSEKIDNIDRIFDDIDNIQKVLDLMSNCQMSKAFLELENLYKRKKGLIL